MKHIVKVAAFMLYAFMFSACEKTPTTISTVTEHSEAALQTNDKMPGNKILVDASRDGGAWWYPQEPSIGFSSDAYHQGQELADYLRIQGYEVDELPRGITITDDLLNQYDKVIRASAYGTYTFSEIEAYDHFISRTSSLILLQDHLLYVPNDNLSEHLGVQFAGGVGGGINEFASNPITAGVTSLSYGYYGSVVINATDNSTMTILGWVNNTVSVGNISSRAVMGTLNSYPNCRIFFMGEVNELETLPQPFVDNLIRWAFK